MKIRWITFFFVALFLLWAEIVLFSYLEIREIRPDLLLILAVYIALSAPDTDAVIAVWFLGILLDLTSCTYFGFFSLCYTVAALFTLKWKAGVFVEHPLSVVFFTFFISLQYNLFHALILFLFYNVSFFLNGLFCAVYTAILTPILIPLLNKLLVVRP